MPRPVPKLWRNWARQPGVRAVRAGASGERERARRHREAGRRGERRVKVRRRRPLLHRHRVHRRAPGRPDRLRPACSTTTRRSQHGHRAGRHPRCRSCATSSTSAAWRSRTWATSRTSRSPARPRPPRTARARTSATSRAASSGCGSITADGSVLECSADDERRRVRGRTRRPRRARHPLDGHACSACPRSACTPSRSRCRSTTCSATSTAS